MTALSEIWALLEGTHTLMEDVTKPKA